MTKNPVASSSAIPLRQHIVSPQDAANLHRKLLCVALSLVLAHGLAMLSMYSLGHDMVFGLVPLLDLYEEHNLPTYFSSFNLLLTAGMLYLIARLDKAHGAKNAMAWKTLSVGFLFMSVDEFADVHIVLSRAVKAAIGGLDALPLASAWTVPVAAIVLVLAVYFVPFLMRLGTKYRVHFALAGACFVFAAIGLEIPEGNHALDTNGVRDLPFMAMVTIEESLEMFSVLYFQYYLIKYLAEHYGNSAIHISY